MCRVRQCGARSSRRRRRRRPERRPARRKNTTIASQITFHGRLSELRPEVSRHQRLEINRFNVKILIAQESIFKLSTVFIIIIIIFNS